MFAEMPLSIKTHLRKSANYKSVQIREKITRLFLPLVGAAFIILATAAATSPDQQEDAEEHEAVGEIEVIVKVRDSQERTAG